MEITTKILRDFLCEEDLSGQIKRGEIYAAFDALEADAQRYRGLRLLICEPDEATRGRMLDACDQMMMAQPDFDEPAPTPQRIDELFDQLILTAAGARNADG